MLYLWSLLLMVLKGEHLPDQTGKKDNPFLKRLCNPELRLPCENPWQICRAGEMRHGDVGWPGAHLPEPADSWIFQVFPPPENLPCYIHSRETSWGGR